MKTIMQELMENFNLLSDADFKAWVLNTDLIAKEKWQIVTAYDLAYMDSFVDDVCKSEKPNDGESFYQWYYGDE